MQLSDDDGVRLSAATAGTTTLASLLIEAEWSIYAFVN